MQRKIVVHHIGGRDGGTPIPPLKRFDPDMIFVLYEADTDTVKQINRLWADRECDTRIYPYCIAKETGEAVLHVNFEGYTSSLRPLNPEVAHYYMHFAHFGLDFILGECVRTMERRPVHTVSLDDLMRRPEFADAPPDFLSLDTQGTEYEILEGSREILPNVLAVYCEAEFVEVYQGQKLFCDLVALLGNAGFRMMHINLHEGFAPMRAPIGARAKGRLFGSDVLFLREVDTVGGGPAERHLALHKLAFISLLFELLEHGLSVLNVARGINIPADIRESFGAISYYRFLAQLQEIVAAMPQRRPPTYSEVKSFEDMQARFRS
jgi:FkbM family methyltransferase